jgi:protocatechuate 3,4-dioxygenase beta subunit
MTTEEYVDYMIMRMEESSKKRTPEESRQIFVRLGILDEEGNAMPGREALVWHLMNYPTDPEE